MSLVTSRQQKPLYNTAYRIDRTDWRGKLALPLTILLFLSISIVVFFYLLWPKITTSGLGLFRSPLSSAGGSGYQAVFLANGQVFFGRLSSFYSSEPVLREVYYLKVGAVLEETQKDSKVEIKKIGKEASPSSTLKVTPTPTPAPVVRTSLNLIKLGEEIYGPSDEMRLNKQQILYVEELRSDSKVVQSIKSFNESLRKK